MKVKLNEAKEELPVSFLTSFVSDGWDKVGILKENIAAIKETFAGTKKVEELIQDLIDAYLVCIGQMEMYLENKNYIEYPDEEEIKESLKENLEEDLVINVDKVEVQLPKDAPEIEDNDDCMANVYAETPVESEQIEAPKADEPFEYFVQFEDPEPDVEAAAEIQKWLLNNQA